MVRKVEPSRADLFKQRKDGWDLRFPAYLTFCQVTSHTLWNQELSLMLYFVRGIRLMLHGTLTLFRTPIEVRSSNIFWLFEHILLKRFYADFFSSICCTTTVFGLNMASLNNNDRNPLKVTKHNDLLDVSCRLSHT